MIFVFRQRRPRTVLLTAVLLAWVACFSSCKQGVEKPPLPEEKMQQVLLDIHLAETYSLGLGDSTRNRFEKNYDSLAVFYRSILKHHGLTFEAFNDALSWYRERPEAIDSLYVKVINRLSELKAKEHIPDEAAQAEGKAQAPPPPPPSLMPDSMRQKLDHPEKLIQKTEKPKMDEEP